jgi:AraC-like DNA-binding protein
MPRSELANATVIGYKGAATGQTYEMWREQLCRSFRLDVAPSVGRHVECEVTLKSVSHLTLGTAKGVSARFARTRELLSDGCDDFVLVSATGGPVLVTQEDEPIALLRSQMCLTDLSVCGSVGFYGNEHFTTTRIPRRALLDVCPRAEQRLSQAVHENTPLRALVARYCALMTELAHEMDAVGQRMAAQHLVDLVGLLLGADRTEKDLARQRGYPAARLELMKKGVLQNLDRPDLTIGSVARSLGLSSRQAQRLFSETGTTFTEFVVEQRLLFARRLLSEPCQQHSKITTIAQATGFSDPSYFNRAFRKRFGATPTDLRTAFATDLLEVGEASPRRAPRPILGQGAGMLAHE